MPHVKAATKHNPWRATTIVFAALLVIAAALGSIGYANAGDNPAPDTVEKSFSNIPTPKADATDASGGSVCTTSLSFEDMPAMTDTFTLGGSVSKPVIVLFQGEWTGPEGSGANIRLAIDGVPQSGPGGFLIPNENETDGDSFETETNGFNFISDPQTPGAHTARIQWSRNPGDQGPCVASRSMIVFHK